MKLDDLKKDWDYSDCRIIFSPRLSKADIFYVTKTGAKVRLMTADNDIRVLKFHEGTLYYGGKDGVFEAVTGKKKSSFPASRLVSNQGTLYGSHGEVGIFDVYTNDVIYDGLSFLYDIASHNGQLYHSQLGKIFNTKNKQPLTSLDGYINSMATVNGKLYASSFVRWPICDSILYNVTDKKEIMKGPLIHDIFAHQNKLFAVGDHGSSGEGHLFDILDDQNNPLVYTVDPKTICSVPAEFCHTLHRKT